MSRCRANHAHLITGVLFALLLGGCATPQTTALLAAAPPGLPARVELTEVPYYAQEDHQCGPAALAMLLHTADIDISPADLAAQVYLPGRAGSLQIEMLAATRRHGLIAYPVTPGLEALLGEIAAGRPAVVLQNLAFGWYPVWHYAVVIGYNLERGEILLRSGPEARQVLPLTTFERTWQRGGYWAMLALPPAQLPRSADTTRYIDAAVALEKTGQVRAARTAYATALTRWPDHLTARIGLGNTAYALGDFAAAEQAFRAAAAAHPDAAVAFNNLADTLARQQRYSEALPAAQEAVRLGGAQAEVFAQTLREIKNKMPH